MRWRAAAPLAMVGCLACSSPVLAWGPNGVPVSRAPGSQTYPVITLDGSGGAFIAWSDTRQDPDRDIFLQHLTSSGAVAPGWPADGVPVCTAPRDQFAEAIASDGAGGALVAWADSHADPGDVYMQRITASGVPAPGWPLNGLAVAIAPDDQDVINLASDGAGGAFVAWDSMAVFSFGNAAYLHHVLGSGEIAPGWPRYGRQLSPEHALSASPQVLADGSGGVLLAWSVTDAGLRAQHLTFAGEVAPGWPAAGVVIPTQYWPGLRRVASDEAGGLYLGWEEYNALVGPYGTSDVFAQHVTGAGVIAPGWPAAGLQLTDLPGSTQGDMKLCSDGLGGMCAVWSDDRNSQVYALRVASDGQRPPGWPANGLPVATQFGIAAQVAPDRLGGMYAVWDGTYDVFAQHLTGSGQIAPGWSTSGTALAPDARSRQEHVQIAGDGLGGAIVTWQDARDYSTSTFDIYAQKLEADGPVPVALALVSAEASPGRAVLTWFAADRLARSATVYRRTASSEWLTLATVSSEGTGRITYEDRAVESGGRYAYRLGYRDGEGEGFSAETWLDIPSGYRLALEGLRPNPAQGRLVVSFMLPSAERATLELIDVTGRRVAAREVGSLGAGRHLLELSDGAHVPAGLYWLRLIQGGRVLTARGVVAR